MKLGTQTASVANHLLARGTIGQPDPAPGMGATILRWSDRSPGTIFRVFQHKGNIAVEVRDDDYKLVDGSRMSESQKYEFKVNVRGGRHYFVFIDGFWREAYFKTQTYDENGRPVRSSKLSLAKRGQGHGLRIGARDAYYDPTF